MPDSSVFDLWADSYDRDVSISDREGSYPFAGYREVLGRIFRIVAKKPTAAVLDLGFGTGTLAAGLSERGCTVYGQDLSASMLKIAEERAPGARFYLGDLSLGLAGPLLEHSYDFITATYSLHHLTNDRKFSLLRDLRGLLNEGGRILIGDVAFETRRQLERCRQKVGAGWDGSELYFVADELRDAFPELQFIKVSFCSGILILNG